MGFGQKWRGWIKECVCSASMSVLINGSLSKPFKMERGLRQGDPLSPFLFVLVVDVLHRMIGEAVTNGRISLLLVGRDHIELSHLQFADDTILFCPPEEETIRNYKRLLRCFEPMSGLSINFEKSSFIPVNCEQRWTRQMCQLLGCKEASLPVRYLGISLGANPRLVKTWKPVIDKVEEKLSLWKAKTLNKVGKLVLIKSVLNSLPIYYLSLYKMLKPVAEKLISLQRRFLWSKDDGKIGMPLVRWEIVMAPRKAGRLGVGDAVVRNTALLFKCLFLQEGALGEISVSSRSGSHNKRKDYQRLIYGCREWQNNQVLEGCLATWWKVERDVSKIFLGLKPHRICYRGVRVLGWVIQEAALPEKITSYSFTSAIWRGFAPPKVELFSWFVLVERVNTKERLCKLGVIDQHDNMCVLCCKYVESASHLFIGCEITWQVWCAWLFALGRIWTMPERNGRIFNNKGSGVMEIINRSFMLSDEWLGGEPLGY
ncbi:uncharacterized protein LOC107604964 [Arachis ipaensis]|uniref:uncharacterized protein LOC107604964 n=1 Tax=Arachis ipaensis TaxID=130454 RepID=UPI0007AFA79E|nr:uncharacterized protein LOC107604964 [Arachis ipaensis]